MASFGLESCYLTLAGWLSFIQFSVCPGGGTYLSNTKEIRGGLNICKNIKKLHSAPPHSKGIHAISFWEHLQAPASSL